MSVDSCRLCAQNGSDQVILSSILDNQDLLQMVKKHICITVHPDDGLSHKICKTCCDTVINWHTFWKKCLDTQSLLNPLVTSEKNISQKLTHKLANTKPNCPKTTPSAEQKNRGSYCIAEWCNNNNTICSMFRIPKENDRGSQWLVNSGRKDLLSLDAKKRSNLYLCEKHFTDNMFTNSRKERLNRNAVPTIFSEPRIVSQKIDHSEEDMESVLHQRMDAVTCSNGKLRKILPKNIEPNISVSNASIIKNSIGILNSVPIHNVDQAPTADSLKIASSDQNPLKLHKMKSIKYPHKALKKKERKKKVAAQENSNKIIDELCPPSQAEEESSMTLDDSYFQSNSLLDFQESVHRCAFCGEVFAIKNSLSNHLKTYHLIT